MNKKTRKQKGKGPKEEALKLLKEYERAKKDYDIAEGERQRVISSGEGWSNQMEKISADASNKHKKLIKIDNKLKAAEKKAGLSRSELIMEKLKINNPRSTSKPVPMDVDTKEDMADYRYETMAAKEEILKRQRQHGKGKRKTKKRQKGGLQSKHDIFPFYDRKNLTGRQREVVNNALRDSANMMLRSMHGEDVTIEIFIDFLLEDPVLEVLNDNGYGPGGPSLNEEPEFDPDARNIVEEYIRVQDAIIHVIKLSLDKTAETLVTVLKDDWHKLELEEKARLVIYLALNKIQRFINNRPLVDIDAYAFDIN